MSANQERDLTAEAAALLAEAKAATLATVQDGMPYAALVTPALEADGHLLLLLSDLSAHTRQLREVSACALLFVGQASSENPQTAPRLMVTAKASLAEREPARASYLKIHPYAELYVDFADFNFFRVEITGAHYVGGFAAAAALDVAHLQSKVTKILQAK